MPSRRARSSAFGKGETQDGGKKAGKEKPTTDEAGGKVLESDAASASQEIDVSFGTHGVDSGTGPGVSVGVGMGSAHGVTTSLSVVPSSGQDNVAAGGMSRSALGGDTSVRRELV